MQCKPICKKRAMCVAAVKRAAVQRDPQSETSQPGIEGVARLRLRRLPLDAAMLVRPAGVLPTGPGVIEFAGWAFGVSFLGDQAGT